MTTITIGVDLAQLLARRMPFGKLLVAIANKHARQLWAMLARGEDYDPGAWSKHPMLQRALSQQPFPSIPKAASLLHTGSSVRHQFPAIRPTQLQVLSARYPFTSAA